MELPIYSVSGRVTEENDPDIGVPGVKLKFGLLGTTTTGAEGRWSKNGLTRRITIEPAKSDYKFIPETYEVSGNESDIIFEARWLDYGGYVEGAVWEYRVTVTDRSGVNPPETHEDSWTIEVISADPDPVNGWTDFELTNTIGDFTEPFSIRRQGEKYYDISNPDNPVPLFTAHFSQGQCIEGGYEIKRQEVVKTPAGEYEAWLCVKEFTDKNKVIKRWYVPYVGLVKEEEYLNMQELSVRELLSYEGQ